MALLQHSAPFFWRRYLGVSSYPNLGNALSGPPSLPPAIRRRVAQLVFSLCQNLLLAQHPYGGYRNGSHDRDRRSLYASVNQPPPRRLPFFGRNRPPSDGTPRRRSAYARPIRRRIKAANRPADSRGIGIHAGARCAAYRAPPKTQSADLRLLHENESAPHPNRPTTYLLYRQMEVSEIYIADV